MTLQQLEYIVAVDTHRHFGRAAEACFVTQPTLSMMIAKLEDEFKLKLFDRSRKPVVPTETGVLLIAQARKILGEKVVFGEIVDQQKGIVQGEFRVGIIPTLAPYLMPLFIQSFLDKYPNVHLRISELLTVNLVEKLKNGALDAGILVTPIKDPYLTEYPLFYEGFYVYSNNHYSKKYLLPEDLNLDELWLLEEGHCFRSQILNLCELRRNKSRAFDYETGSIETLKRLVEQQNGVTILPELATLQLSEKEREMLKEFQPPTPVREVSVVTHRDFVKRRLVDALKDEIMATIPLAIQEREGEARVEID